MGYKLSNLKFVDKKHILDNVHFEINDSEFTTIFTQDKKQKKFIKDTLKGKKRILSGRFQIDDADLVGSKFVKSKVDFIAPDIWFERLIPPRIILNLSLLFDQKFLRLARIKKNDKKFDYLSFVDSHNDLTEMQLRREIDKTISFFLNKAINLNKTLHKAFINEIKKINNKQNEKMFAQFYAQIKVMIMEYFNLILKWELDNLALTFYQVVWDQIYSFQDLRHSCPCEYNVKHSSNEHLKDNIFKFKYKQPYYMIQKQLKIINIRISELRIALFKTKKLTRATKKQITWEIKKFFIDNKIPKEEQAVVHEYLNNWKKTIQDLVDDFKVSQKKGILESIRQEGAIIEKEIIHLTHEYHKKVLAQTNKIGNKNEFKILKKHYKKQIESIYKQSMTWTQENLKKLNIKFDWYLKSGFKISSINIIYLKILKAINMHKKNIVFYNIIKLLTKNDVKLLMNTIQAIQKEHPNLCFINLTDDFSSIIDFKQKVYAVNPKNQLTNITPEAIYNKGVLQSMKPFTNINLISYKKVEQGIEFEERFWPVQSTSFNETGKININPFMIKLEEQKDVAGQLILEVLTKVTYKFLDRKMWVGITNSGSKINFYSNRKLEPNKKILIYIQPAAIIIKKETNVNS
ncbi:hypothetical protein [Williamsoniiplasma lucivorax]|uniref:Uncharacterized protein n=1 Tax=Williamsoniiplasma lucivorax TaxID=209274 RepID=A0A2S5RFE3_9MOLU|nr:hypothetical protein [Williamsoniiplasma lucivorax]PPE06031.1 hypothetical protein ELUCI_v1c03220 [Williamsoniiplasma lucivorax]